ncbi:hypothetical protein [Humibacillus xanthopallidus]|uniref:Uncharacterized protein n=1 Tax=Humibacillus xanthopallidus TaxID=412689 RepID=A0A543I3J9_9MICO|nr:hypothetical protein [Humibacillus xanthopallidus]TQM65145.1 hypothetical protein FBY41_1530 [Humibacillus xanthopallidus]
MRHLPRRSRAVVTVRMSPEEFDQLIDSWVPAGAILAGAEHGRFRNEANDIVSPSASWSEVYDFGENYAAVLLAKAFLDAVDADYEVVQDMAPAAQDGDAWNRWRIFSNYDTPE